MAYARSDIAPLLVRFVQHGYKYIMSEPRLSRMPNAQDSGHFSYSPPHGHLLHPQLLKNMLGPY
jgi:hypothetical protein